MNPTQLRSSRRIPAFDYKRLAKAITIREQSYKLLLWIADAINKGLIQPSRAGRHSGGPDAAIEWFASNYHHIPEALRPPESDIQEFAAFFSTFLTSSFDVVEHPGMKGDGPTPLYCQCPLCTRIVNASHLQTKKLYARDRRRANFLMSECVVRLAEDHGVEIEESFADKLVTDDETRRYAAYLAYGHWLIRRLSGESDGPSILALWRIIAWYPQGNMRRGFTLELVDFEFAERELLGAIRNMKKSTTFRAPG